MDHAQIVDQLRQRCKQGIDTIVHAPDLQGIAAASLAICVQVRALAHALLPAKINLEAQRRKQQPVVPCCPGAARASVPAQGLVDRRAPELGAGRPSAYDACPGAPRPVRGAVLARRDVGVLGAAARKRCSWSCTPRAAVPFPVPLP
ncbi:MAG: hypothetical protein KatS3mg131_1959 [Candidatus Tectimicrobiota bacterium]|nr:MAG: hypothetical protein KatS3mg131_1959 [Candidatus Tectomicrobia bacterium]